MVVIFKGPWWWRGQKFGVGVVSKCAPNALQSLETSIKLLVNKYDQKLKKSTQSNEVLEMTKTAKNKMLTVKMLPDCLLQLSCDCTGQKKFLGFQVLAKIFIYMIHQC